MTGRHCFLAHPGFSHRTSPSWSFRKIIVVRASSPWFDWTYNGTLRRPSRYRDFGWNPLAPATGACQLALAKSRPQTEAVGPRNERFARLSSHPLDRSPE